MLVPNGNFLKFFPDAELTEELPVSSRSGCIKIGAWLVIGKVIRHYRLDERIGDIIGKDAGLFLDLASYAIITENNAAQHYPDYLFFTEETSIYTPARLLLQRRRLTCWC